MDERLPGFVDYEGYTLERGLASVGEGWADLVRRAFEAKPEGTQIVQVKEKFGGLRIYPRRSTPSYINVLRDIEAESNQICERCGKPGSLDYYRYYAQTLCDEHKKERRNRMASRS